MVFQNCGQPTSNTSPLPSLHTFCPSSQSSQQKAMLPDILGPGSVSLLIDLACPYLAAEDFTVLTQTFAMPEARQGWHALSLEVTAEEWTQLNEEKAQHPCWLAIAQDDTVRIQSEATAASENSPDLPSHLTAIGFSEHLWLMQNISHKVRLAIIDSGIDYQHTNIKDSLWVNAQGQSGYNFISSNDDPFDDEGHGTHVAGIIAGTVNAETNSRGVANGIVEIMSLKALDQSGYGKTTHIYNSVRYAIDQGADIININIATDGPSPLLEAALVEAVQAGVLVVVAIGNQSLEISPQQKIAPAYIAKDLNGVVAVASVTASTQKLSTFSNFSPTYAEIAAPGEVNGTNGGGILSTYPDQSFARLRGTSQASPLVAASAALLISYLKTHNIAYNLTSLEKFLLHFGSQENADLASVVQEGRILNLQNLSIAISENHATWLKSGEMEYYQKHDQLCAQAGQ